MLCFYHSQIKTKDMMVRRILNLECDFWTRNGKGGCHSRDNRVIFFWPFCPLGKIAKGEVSLNPWLLQQSWLTLPLWSPFQKTSLLPLPRPTSSILFMDSLHFFLPSICFKRKDSSKLKEPVVLTLLCPRFFVAGTRQ